MEVSRQKGYDKNIIMVDGFRKETGYEKETN